LREGRRELRAAIASDRTRVVDRPSMPSRSRDLH